MRGLRRVPKPKPPRERPGLDHPAHLATVRALPCLLKGKRGVIRKWVGRYPDVEEVEVEVIHQCSGPRSQAHHTTRKAQRGSDLTTVPLCAAGHALVHSMGQAEVEIVFEIDLKAEAKRLREQARRAP